MDFSTPEPIRLAIERRLQHPVLGYEERQPEYAEAVANWLQRRHGWQVPNEWLMFCPPSSIVAMYGLVVSLTQPGDGVIVPVPTYGPLIDLVCRTDRRLLRNPLRESTARFELDLEHMSSLVDKDTRMILLCSPHNPTGRVFSSAELQGIADLADKHDLIVVCDEVHADLVRPGYRHRPYGSLGHIRSATVISPNKAFNTAGLPQASLVMPDGDMRKSLQGFLDTTAVNHDSTFGGVAMLSAYRDCESWLEEVVKYIDENHRHVQKFLGQHLPALRVWPAEATYLAWLDYRSMGISEEEVQQRLVHQGGVGLYSGSLFGTEGTGFLRMNVACPRQTLNEGLDGILRALVPD